MSDDVEGILRGLTKGERAILEDTQPGEVRGYLEVHGLPRVSLIHKGVIGSTPYHGKYRFQLTPLGECVRSPSYPPL